MTLCKADLKRCFHALVEGDLKVLITSKNERTNGGGVVLVLNAVATCQP